MTMPRGKRIRIPDAWPGLIQALRHNRDLRSNLLVAIVDATRAELKGRGAPPKDGAQLVEAELEALEAFDAKLRRTFADLDDARQRVGLWSATIEAGDKRGWGRQ